MTAVMRDLQDFLPLVLPHAPGCPKQVAIQNLRLAAIDWCERTRCWRSVQTVDVTEQGNAVVAPDYATIFEIETAHFDGVELTPLQYSEINPDDMAEGVGNGRPPQYIAQTSPNTVTLIPFMAGQLRLSLFLKPRSGDEFGQNGTGGYLHLDQNRVPEHIFVQSAESITHGALSRLLMMPQADWRDDKKGLYYAGLFEAKATSRFDKGIKGQQVARVRARSQFM